MKRPITGLVLAVAAMIAPTALPAQVGRAVVHPVARTIEQIRQECEAEVRAGGFEAASNEFQVRVAECQQQKIRPIRFTLGEWIKLGLGILGCLIPLGAGIWLARRSQRANALPRMPLSPIVVGALISIPAALIAVYRFLSS